MSRTCLDRPVKGFSLLVAARISNRPDSHSRPFLAQNDGTLVLTLSANELAFIGTGWHYMVVDPH